MKIGVQVCGADGVAALVLADEFGAPPLVSICKHYVAKELVARFPAPDIDLIGLINTAEVTKFFLICNYIYILIKVALN